MPLSRRGWLGVAAAMLAGVSPAGAAAPDVDRAAVQGIIRAQMDAFRRDDAAAAFGYAAPTLQEKFGTPDTFISMVRSVYAPVYRPSSVAFGALTTTPDGLMQSVNLVGPDGLSYVATYTMQRQPDGTWKIGGCSLEKGSEVSA